jgi:ribosome maturation factor RimP
MLVVWPEKPYYFKYGWRGKKMIRKITSIFLMVCLIGLSTAYRAVGAEVHSPDSSGLLKQKVELLGIGANLRVKLADGQKMKGQVSSLDDTGFTLEPQSGGLSRQVDYGEITELALLTRNYRASGAPDASEARRVIVALGVGQHVMVRTTEMKIHGQIMTVERDHFVILPDDQANPVRIAYQNVEQAGKNLGILSTIGLVVVVIAVIAIVSWAK